MRPTPAVVDAAAQVTFLTDDGATGTWIAAQLRGRPLAAPHLMAFEAQNVLRRHEAAGLISADVANQAHADLLRADIEFWPHSAVAVRAWELRKNLTCYDSAYVALAERIGGTLITLDRRIGRAPGLRCDVVCPPEAY